MNFLPENIENYALSHTDSESELLKKINTETCLEVAMPRMISGHLQGRFLSMLSKMIAPENILEIGTYTGYSALCLAEGLKQNGQLITIDKNQELETRVRGYFDESIYKNQITYTIGIATEIIPELDKKWDIVFIDADKKNYSLYFDLVIDKVKTGGYIIADNVLWSGKVADPNIKIDSKTKAMMDFNTKIHQDLRVENILVPIRDGLMIARKK